MAINKRTMQARQAKQFSQLLKDYGIITHAYHPSAAERKKIDELFPD